MRVGLLGGGTIARLFIEHIRRGDLGPGVEVAAIVGRPSSLRSARLAEQYGISLVTDVASIVARKPDVVVEAASHDAVREYCEPLLANGIAVIVLSGGALCDDKLRVCLEDAAKRSGALLYVPSGGIAGLDGLKAACVAGVDEVQITVMKPPSAWKNIPYVDRMEINLDSLCEPRTLYEGTARAGVPMFPANVNIAAVLSMAGIGFDRTRLKVVADPALTHNTHIIEIRGNTGNIYVRLENVPSPDNPKTAWLACYSALAALKLALTPVRYGT
jgi:aspartate dehydrogenase